MSRHSGAKTEKKELAGSNPHIHNLLHRGMDFNCKVLRQSTQVAGSALLLNLTKVLVKMRCHVFILTSPFPCLSRYWLIT